VPVWLDGATGASRCRRFQDVPPVHSRQPKSSEIADSAARDGQSLGSEEGRFQLWIRAVPAHPAAGGHNPVVGQPRHPGRAHDVAHGASGTGTAGKGRHVAIGRHSSGRDALKDAQDSLSEYGRKRSAVRRHRINARALRSARGPAPLASGFRSAWQMSRPYRLVSCVRRTVRAGCPGQRGPAARADRSC